MKAFLVVFFVSILLMVAVGTFMAIWIAFNDSFFESLPNRYGLKRSHLGWKLFRWDPKIKRLRSPAMDTIWHAKEMEMRKFEGWEERFSFEMGPGLYSALSTGFGDILEYMRRNWWNYRHPAEWIADRHSRLVYGLVERYKRYVLGSKGWRAEWVVIRKLATRSPKDAKRLREAYPDIEVILVPKGGWWPELDYM